MVATPDFMSGVACLGIRFCMHLFDAAPYYPDRDNGYDDYNDYGDDATCIAVSEITTL